VPLTARAIAVSVVALGLSSLASAAEPTKVAVAPVRHPEGGQVIERALTEAVQSFPSLLLVHSAKESKWTLTAELAPIGDDLIVYLQGVETAGGNSLGSTTVSLASKPKVLSASEIGRLRAAVAKILVPSQYTGKLAIHVDAKDAEAVVDGLEVSLSAPIDLPVGPHTLRVTHPAYRDFMHFVEISYGRTETVDVKLAMFPLSEGEMVQRRKAKAQAKAAKQKPLPWYRRWYSMVAAGVVLAGATATITYFARPDPIHSDAIRTFKPTTGP
jgi:hypothetical protein